MSPELALGFDAGLLNQRAEVTRFRFIEHGLALRGDDEVNIVEGDAQQVDVTPITDSTCVSGDREVVGVICQVGIRSVGVC